MWESAVPWIGDLPETAEVAYGIAKNDRVPKSKMLCTKPHVKSHSHVEAGCAPSEASQGSAWLQLGSRVNFIFDSNLQTIPNHNSLHIY